MSEVWSFTLASVTDGDTVRAHLCRQEVLQAKQDPTIVVAGWSVQGIANRATAVLIKSTEPKGEPLRLVTLDTPERGDEPGFSQARQDVRDWLAHYEGRLEVETYLSGGFDRLLADVYEIGNRGNTLSQHMLRIGWNPYVKS